MVARGQQRGRLDLEAVVENKSGGRVVPLTFDSDGELMGDCVGLESTVSAFIVGEYWIQFGTVQDQLHKCVSWSQLVSVQVLPAFVGSGRLGTDHTAAVRTMKDLNSLDLVRKADVDGQGGLVRAGGSPGVPQAVEK